MCAALAVDNVSRDHWLTYFVFVRNGGLVRKGGYRQSIDSGEKRRVDDLWLALCCTSNFLGSETTTGRISVVLCGTSSLLTGETNLVCESYKSLAKRTSGNIRSATRVHYSRGSIPRSDPVGGERSPRNNISDILLLSELLESFVRRFLDLLAR